MMLERKAFEAWALAAGNTPAMVNMLDPDGSYVYLQQEWLAWSAATAAERERLQRTNDVLRAERDHARANVENAVRLLTGIHALMYPAPITMANGRTTVFRPKDPDPHAILQELSDRIRALPDELAAIRAPKEG